MEKEEGDILEQFSSNWFLEGAQFENGRNQSTSGSELSLSYPSIIIADLVGNHYVMIDCLRFKERGGVCYFQSRFQTRDETMR